MNAETTERYPSLVCFNASIISADVVGPVGKWWFEIGFGDSADEEDDDEEVLLTDIQGL